MPGVKAATGLREGGRALSQSRERHRARKALVVVQVALALVLLICSGLMIRTFQALMHVDPGFTAPESLETFRFYIPETQIPETQPERVVHQQQEILNKLAAFPACSRSASQARFRWTATTPTICFTRRTTRYREGEIPPIRRFKFVSPGFFATLGTQLVAGRDITWTDTYEKHPVAIISENFAREYWHSAATAPGQEDSRGLHR